MTEDSKSLKKLHSRKSESKLLHFDSPLIIKFFILLYLKYLIFILLFILRKHDFKRKILKNCSI